MTRFGNSGKVNGEPRIRAFQLPQVSSNIRREILTLLGRQNFQITIFVISYYEISEISVLYRHFVGPYLYFPGRDIHDEAQIRAFQTTQIFFAKNLIEKYCRRKKLWPPTFGRFFFKLAKFRHLELAREFIYSSRRIRKTRFHSIPSTLKIVFRHVGKKLFFT